MNAKPSEAARGSRGAFPDGGRFRIEIPSVEGPEVLDAVFAEAARTGVVIHRVSQGSGVAMLSDAEISRMVETARSEQVELCLFLGPRGTWDIGGSTRTPSGGSGARVRGAAQVGYSIEDAQRAAGLGVDCLLVADEGVLWELHLARQDGRLPAELTLKFSALSGPANPSSLRVIEQLGADSVNVPGDLSLVDLAAMREASLVPLDLYIESPDALGGFVRQHETPEFIDRVGRLYVKFGLRNAPEMYPSGLHTRALTLDASRERVRRAALLLEDLERRGYMEAMSPKGAPVVRDLRRFEDVERKAG